jgi:hypothetical protein
MRIPQNDRVLAPGLGEVLQNPVPGRRRVGGDVKDGENAEIVPPP